MRIDLSHVNEYLRSLGIAASVPVSIDARGEESLRSILLCPFPGVPGVGLLDNSAWPILLHFLRSYGLPVRLMGMEGERKDNCTFSENDILSGLPFSEKANYLVSAALVVGVPNLYTWVASCCNVPMVVLYPDWLDTRLWFPFSGEKIGRVLIERKTQTPTLLAGMRQLIAQL